VGHFAVLTCLFVSDSVVHSLRQKTYFSHDFHKARINEIHFLAYFILILYNRVRWNALSLSACGKKD
jgi:hypothetical protein